MAKAFNSFSLTFRETLKVVRLAFPTIPTGAGEVKRRAGAEGLLRYALTCREAPDPGATVPRLGDSSRHHQLSEYL